VNRKYLGILDCVVVISTLGSIIMMIWAILN